MFGWLFVHSVIEVFQTEFDWNIKEPEDFFEKHYKKLLKAVCRRIKAIGGNGSDAAAAFLLFLKCFDNPLLQQDLRDQYSFYDPIVLDSSQDLARLYDLVPNIYDRCVFNPND